MARADLMCELIKYGLLNDNLNFRKAAEALCAEERAKQHTILANKIQDLLSIEKKQAIERNSSTKENGKFDFTTGRKGYMSKYD